MYCIVRAVQRTGISYAGDIYLLLALCGSRSASDLRPLVHTVQLPTMGRSYTFTAYTQTITIHEQVSYSCILSVLCQHAYIKHCTHATSINNHPLLTEAHDLTQFTGT